MSEKTNLPARKVVIGKAERIKRNGFFDHEPNVVEPCEICGGMHDSDVLTVCALQRAKKMMVEAETYDRHWAWGIHHDGYRGRSGD